MTPDQLIAHLSEHYIGDVQNPRIDKGHAVIDVEAGKVTELIKALKSSDELYFDMLMDLTVVDWQPREPRFDLVYHLYSVKHNHRLRIKAAVEDGQSVPTATKLYPIADWFEREMWDLYGVKFAGNPNLKRLLLYEEFKGHPLRKDYHYDKRQPLLEETWPSRRLQVQLEEGKKIHRP